MKEGVGCISVPQDLSSLGGSSCLLDKVANLLCKIILKHLERFLTIIINELEIVIDSVLVLRKKYDFFCICMIYIYIYFFFYVIYFIFLIIIMLFILPHLYTA